MHMPVKARVTTCQASPAAGASVSSRSNQNLQIHRMTTIGSVWIGGAAGFALHRTGFRSACHVSTCSRKQPGGVSLALQAYSVAQDTCTHLSQAGNARMQTAQQAYDQQLTCSQWLHVCRTKPQRRCSEQVGHQGEYQNAQTAQLDLQKLLLICCTPYT